MSVYKYLLTIKTADFLKTIKRKRKKLFLTNPLLANSNQSIKQVRFRTKVFRWLSAMKKSGNIQNAFLLSSSTQFFPFISVAIDKNSTTRLNNDFIAFSSAAVSDSQHFYYIFYFFLLT